jgi:hypothetical protein
VTHPRLGLAHANVGDEECNQREFRYSFTLSSRLSSLCTLCGAVDLVGDAILLSVREIVVSNSDLAWGRRYFFDGLDWFDVTH